MAAISSGEMPNNRYIPRSPNGETPRVPHETFAYAKEHTQGSETSQYLEE